MFVCERAYNMRPTPMALETNSVSPREMQGEVTYRMARAAIKEILYPILVAAAPMPHTTAKNCPTLSHEWLC